MLHATICSFIIISNRHTHTRSHVFVKRTHVTHIHPYVCVCVSYHVKLKRTFMLNNKLGSLNKWWSTHTRSHIHSHTYTYSFIHSHTLVYMALGPKVIACFIVVSSLPLSVFSMATQTAILTHTHIRLHLDELAQVGRVAHKLTLCKAIIMWTCRQACIYS